MNTITPLSIQQFEQELCLAEHAPATIEKYIREIKRLALYLQGRDVTKEHLLAYRACLLQASRPQTVNVILSAVNAYLKFRGWAALAVKRVRVQRAAFLREERELSRAEYQRLLTAANTPKSQRLYLLLLTMGGTGIRVGEVRYITVDAARAGQAQISLKGKTRIVLLQKTLRKQLLRYAKERGIDTGPIFCTRSGKPLDRSNIAHAMKRLCRTARVDPRKVFPHNLRHLFARAFYAVEKNLAHLADVLGHSSIETTRIYVATSAAAHERTLCRMKLIE